MSQPFEVLGHSSSLLFNAHGCSSDGNAPFSLLSNDTLFEYETFTDLNDLFLSVSLASEKKFVYDLIGEVPSGSCQDLARAQHVEVFQGNLCSPTCSSFYDSSMVLKSCLEASLGCDWNFSFTFWPLDFIDLVSTVTKTPNCVSQRRRSVSQ